MTRQRIRKLWLLVGLAGVAVAVGLYFAIPALMGPAGSRPEAPADAQTPVAAPMTPQTSSLPIPAAVGPRVGERAPDFTLRSFDGTTVSLSQFLGRVVILDFWASWCGPCRSTMPTLHALWREVADRGVELIGVSLDRSADAATGYLKATGFGDMLALWDSYAAAQAVATQYRVTGIPHTFVIDRAGIVRFANHPARLARSVLDPLL